MDRDCLLQRGDHKISLADRVAYEVQPGLLLLCVGRLPIAEQGMDGSRIDIGCSGDRADAAMPHILQQEGLRADEYVEIRFAKTVEEDFRVRPITRAVFHASDCGRIGFEQPLYQFRRDANDRDRRDVVEIDAQARVPDSLDDFAEMAIEPVLGKPLVVEWRGGPAPHAPPTHRPGGGGAPTPAGGRTPGA